MKATTILSAAVLILLALACSPARAQTNTLTLTTNVLVERLGVQPGVDVRRMSPDGCHVASIAHTTSGDTLYHDGRRLASWIEILKDSPVFSPDSSRLAYAVVDADQETFPGSNRRPVHWVLDNKAGPAFDAVGADNGVFSPDSKRFAYTADRGNQRVVVEAGRERQVFDLRAPVFSPDSRRLAYVVGREDQRAVAVEDGPQPPDCHLGPLFPEIFVDASVVFSPDSQRIAYVAGKGGRQFCVMDGRPQQDFDGIGTSIIFSPDSKHFMYTAKKDEKWLVVRDGELGPLYDGIGQQSLKFSSDSRRWAYFATQNGKRFAITSEGEGAAYDATAKGSLTFSPDSRRLAYAARLGKQWFVISDNERSQPMDGFLGLRFSPNSRRLVYGADLGGKPTLIVDGRVGPNYHAFKADSPFAFTSTPDSSHLVFVTETGTLGLSQAMALDDQQGPQFDEILPGGPAFRQDGTMEYLALRNGILYSVKKRL